MILTTKFPVETEHFTHLASTCAAREIEHRYISTTFGWRTKSKFKCTTDLKSLAPSERCLCACTAVADSFISLFSDLFFQVHIFQQLFFLFITNIHTIVDLPSKNYVMTLRQAPHIFYKQCGVLHLFVFVRASSSIV